MARIAPPRRQATPKGLRARLIAAVRAAEPVPDPRLVFIPDDAERASREHLSRQQWAVARDEFVRQLENGDRVMFQRWGNAYGADVRHLLPKHWIERSAVCELVGDELVPIEVFRD